MSMFGNEGQSELNPLTDEHIEGQEEEQTPETEVTTEEEPAESETPEGQVDYQARVSELEQQLQKANKQYNELRSFSTRVSMENAELRKTGRKTETEPEAAKRILPPEAQREKAQQFLEDPDAFIRTSASHVLETEIQKAVEAAVSPYVQQEKNRIIGERVQSAERVLEENFPQVMQEGEKYRIYNELGDLSAACGLDRNGWTANPEMFMQAAAIKLYGMPKQVDQQSIDLAASKAREEALAELSQRDNNKTGLTAGNTTMPDAPDDDIVKSIRSAGFASSIF